MVFIHATETLVGTVLLIKTIEGRGEVLAETAHVLSATIKGMVSTMDELGNTPECRTTLD